MEIFTILLSGLLAGLTPPGFIVDTIAESQIRANLEGVDVIEVRVDNTPSYQAVAGKIDRVRIATRGLQLTPNIRLDTLELDTDPLEVDLAGLRGGEPLQALRKPLQAGVRVVLSEADLNAALRSPRVKARIEKILEGVAGNLSRDGGTYRLASTKIDLLGNNRLRFEATLKPPGLTAAELDQWLAANPQAEIRSLQRQLQRAESLDMAQLQAGLARLEALNLEGVQAFAREVEPLDLPPEARVFPRPLPAFDLAALRSRQAALQQALSSPDNRDAIASRASALQQSLTELQAFLAAFQTLNVANARPFTSETEPLNLSLESGIAVESASQLSLVEPTVAIDNNPLPAFVVQTLTSALDSGLDLRRWEASGYTIRLLQLEVEENELKAAAFIRLEPASF